MHTSKKRMFSILLGLSALAMATLACGSSSGSGDGNNPPPANEEPAASGKVGVSSFTLFADDGSGEPGAEVSAFKPSNRIQHFEVKLDRMLKAGTVVKWEFFGIDPGTGKDVLITSVDTTVLLGNNLTAQLELNQDFPAGLYRADVYIDGTLLQGFEYQVQ